jgi:hypothetical protein
VKVEILERAMTTPIAAVGGPANIDAMSGASTSSSPNQKMSSLFDKIDHGGAGSINQSQFDQAFQTLNPPGVFKAQGSSQIWSALDPIGTGSVSKPDFVNAMKDLMAQLRANPIGSVSPVAPGQTLDSSLQSLNILA